MPKSLLFLEQFERLADLQPEDPCAFLLNRDAEIESQLTRRDWLVRAKKAAGALKKWGVVPGDRILLSLPTSEAFLISFLALWYCGAVPVPVPEISTGIKKENHFERLKNIIRDCSPVGIILMDSATKGLGDSGGLKVFPYSELLEIESTVTPQPTPAKSNEDSIAFIQYTSGSTGFPKGVVVTQRCLLGNIQAMEGRAGMSDQDKLLTWMPLYHDMGLIGGIFFPLYFRAKIYLMSTLSFLAHPSVWLKSVSRHRITVSTGPSFAYHLCARRVSPEKIPGLDLSSWRLAYNGAEPIHPHTLAEFETKFAPYGFSRTTHYPVYGMAEATLGVSFPETNRPYHVQHFRREDLIQKGIAVTEPSRNEHTMTLVSVGKCLPGHKLVIRAPESEAILSEGRVGEICFSGPSVSPGYFHDSRPGAPGVFDQPRQELRTGDLGCIVDGYLFIVDRLKDVIKVAGSSYFPSDIELHLQDIPGVRSGRVVAFEVPKADVGTAALVIAAEAENPGSIDESLLETIKKKIYAVFKLIPQDVVLTRKKMIPLTSSGKLMRRRCREMYLAGELINLLAKDQKVRSEFLVAS